jgi:inner membrane protein COX18
MPLLLRARHAPLRSKQLRFLQLPPTCRSFHVSPQPQFIEVAIGTAHGFFEGIHSATGLPWAYAIPLAALAIRTAVVLPLSIYVRRVNQKQVALYPLVQSWQYQLRKETMAEVGHLGPTVAHRKLLQKTRAKRNEIYKRWNCGLWQNWMPLLQLPIFLTAVEALREMCGARVGLLGIISRTSTNELGKTGMLSMELSLATEGMLWFPNLILPDPQLVLPFILSGAMFLSIGKMRKGGVQTAFQRRLTNGLRVVALLVGPIMLDMPSVILLYWISSTLLGQVQYFIMDRIMPLKPPLLPCKTGQGPPEDDIKL